jgi:signal peptidase I
VVTVNDVPIEEASSPEKMDSEEHGLWTLKRDECFLLGDAMDMSTDSRSFGPVARKAVKGRAWLVYWPMSRWRSLGTE